MATGCLIMSYMYLLAREIMGHGTFFLLSTGYHGHAATWEQADGRWQKHRLKENRRRCINGVFLFRYRIQSMHDIEANN